MIPEDMKKTRKGGKNMMKNISKKQQRQINGGRHYHWTCSLNGFTSVAYSSYADCNAAKKTHANKYGHGNYMSIFSCIGNCR